MPVKHLDNLTVEQVRSAFDYDPATGIFIRRVRRSNSNASDATVRDKVGYRILTLKNRLYRAHRVAWLYVYGCWPNGQIDHINGDKADNRIANLREADPSQNAANCVRRVNKNKTGFKGVTKVNQRYRASFLHRGQFIHLGYYETAEAAHAAFARGYAKLNGDFARTA